MFGEPKEEEEKTVKTEERHTILILLNSNTLPSNKLNNGKEEEQTKLIKHFNFKSTTYP